MKKAFCAFLLVFFLLPQKVFGQGYQAGLFDVFFLPILILIVLLIALIFFIVWRTSRSEIFDYKKRAGLFFWKIKFTVKQHNYFMRIMIVLTVVLILVEAVIYLLG